MLKYLARYTHRVAISNSRLADVSNGEVAFSYKDYAKGNERKEMTLSADEFLRRFLQHVLPKGFVKIRHYGLLSNRLRETKLGVCRLLLLLVVLGAKRVSANQQPETTAATPKCEKCGGTRLIKRKLPASRGADSSSPVGADSS